MCAPIGKSAHKGTFTQELLQVLSKATDSDGASNVSYEEQHKTDIIEKKVIKAIVDDAKCYGSSLELRIFTVIL